MVQITAHPLYKKYDLDSAMGTMWEFYKSRFLTLFLTSFLMSIVLQYGTTFINLKELQNITDPEIILSKLKVYIGPILILTLVSLFFSNILHYYVLVNPLDRRKNIFLSLWGSLPFFIPYIITLVIFIFFGSFILAAGLVVFVIGVVFSFAYLMMISFFILTVLMCEGNHIGNTILRTARLSHRNFWNNLGWSSVVLILLIVFSLITSALVMLPFTGGFLKSLLNPEDAVKLADVTVNPLYIVLSSVFNALTLPIFPIFGFIIYFNGRAREELPKVPSYGDEDYRVKVEDLYSKPLPGEESGKAGENKD